MAQHGSLTQIPADVRLILCDCFETLVEPHAGGYRARRGVKDFLLHFSDRQRVPVAVISDAERPAVEEALRQARIRGHLTRVYAADNSAEPLGEGRTRKRLDVPLGEFQVAAERTVFIGDSPLDAEAAAHHGVPFIRVPRSEDRVFSLATLITGPSRYRSAEFSAVFLRHHLGEDAPPPQGPDAG